MGGFGSIDQMIKSFHSNRALLKGTKKSLRTIYQENNYFYIKKRVNAKTKKFDPEQKRIFLKKYHAKQKMARALRTFLVFSIVALFGLLLLLLLFYNSNLIP